MTRALVLQKETILCEQTSNGWQPITIDLPAVIADKPEPYELGRVSLQPDLPCKPSQHDASDKNKHDDSVDTASLAALAISYAYAQSHHITLPLITFDEALHKDHIAGLSASSLDTQVIAFIPYRQLIGSLPADTANLLSQAIQLLRWQADTQFCSRCSAPVSAAKENDRSMVCPVCGLRQYPRVQPCIITAITRPNPSTGAMQILLAHHHRYGRTTLPLQYSLIAGFVEVGESLEHAVAREAFEEVALSLSDIRYISSQPWPFPSNLMIGFQASYASGDIVLQEDELSHADFFDLSDLPKIPFKGSIAYDLIAKVALEHGVVL